MKNQPSYGFIDTDFSLYFEPEGGINTPQDFKAELLSWAKKENKELSILEGGMEPLIYLDGTVYLCRLGEVSAASAKNPIAKALGIKGLNRKIGPLFGYKWVYLYKQ